MHEENVSVVINCNNSGSTLQHKIIALSYHFVREILHSDVVQVRKIGIDNNVSNALTKGLDSSAFNNFIMLVMSN